MPNEIYVNFIHKDNFDFRDELNLATLTFNGTIINLHCRGQDYKDNWHVKKATGTGYKLTFKAKNLTPTKSFTEIKELFLKTIANKTSCRCD